MIFHVCKVAFFDITVFSGEKKVVLEVELGNEVLSVFESNVLFLITDRLQREIFIRRIVPADRHVFPMPQRLTKKNVNFTRQVTEAR